MQTQFGVQSSLSCKLYGLSDFTVLEVSVIEKNAVWSVEQSLGEGFQHRSLKFWSKSREFRAENYTLLKNLLLAYYWAFLSRDKMFDNKTPSDCASNNILWIVSCLALNVKKLCRPSNNLMYIWEWAQARPGGTSKHQKHVAEIPLSSSVVASAFFSTIYFNGSRVLLYN